MRIKQRQLAVADERSQMQAEGHRSRLLFVHAKLQEVQAEAMVARSQMQSMQQEGGGAAGQNEQGVVAMAEEVVAYRGEEVAIAAELSRRAKNTDSPLQSLLPIAGNGSRDGSIMTESRGGGSLMTESRDGGSRTSVSHSSRASHRDRAQEYSLTSPKTNSLYDTLYSNEDEDYDDD